MADKMLPTPKPTKPSPTVVPKLADVLAEMEVESRLLTCVIKVDSVEKAKKIINLYNLGNRPLYKSKYKEYANELLRGKWKLNGEPFIFGIDDKTGVESAISLQHRLFGLISAIDQHNKNPEAYPDAQLYIETAVVYNVPVETADTVDIGLGRKHSHVLYRDEWINKVIPKEWSKAESRKAKWCQTLAVAARLVWLRAGGAMVSSAPKFIVSEMLDFIKEDHTGLCEFVSAVLSANEEEGAGLKISIPYIAALTYVACLDEDGVVDKKLKDKVLDEVLNIAQNNVVPGSASHALVAYWNKLFSTPGSKERDLEIVGPFVKALNAIIADEKVTAAKLALSKKEAETYTTHPPLLKGWDESCFIYAAEVKTEQLMSAERAKEEKERERAEKAAQKEKEKAEKEAEKAAAIKEADDAKAKVPVKSGVMSSLSKVVRRKPSENAGMPTKPMIKKKPIPAGSGK